MIGELIQILGLAASLTVVGAYLQTNRTSDDAWLNWANALCWPFIAVASVAVGAWPAVLITVMFGVIGTWGLWKNRKPRTSEPTQDVTATLDQIAAARLASRRGVELRSAQGRQMLTSWRMPDSVRRGARESLRRSKTTGGQQRR